MYIRHKFPVHRPTYNTILMYAMHNRAQQSVLAARNTVVHANIHDNVYQIMGGNVQDVNMNKLAARKACVASLTSVFELLQYFVAKNSSFQVDCGAFGDAVEWRTSSKCMVMDSI